MELQGLWMFIKILTFLSLLFSLGGILSCGKGKRSEPQIQNQFPSCDYLCQYFT